MSGRAFRCTSCRSENPPGSLHCGNCGRKQALDKGEFHAPDKEELYPSTIEDYEWMVKEPTGVIEIIKPTIMLVVMAEAILFISLLFVIGSIDQPIDRFNMLLAILYSVFDLAANIYLYGGLMRFESKSMQLFLGKQAVGLILGLYLFNIPLLIYSLGIYSAFLLHEPTRALYLTKGHYQRKKIQKNSYLDLDKESQKELVHYYLSDYRGSHLPPNGTDESNFAKILRKAKEWRGNI